MSEVNKQTIDYLTDRVEIVLPEQIESASKVLSRLLLKYHGQLTLFEDKS